MAIVLGGLGQPERGSLAAFGLGAAESDPNAMQAALGGSCSITATLTDGSAPPETPTIGGGMRWQVQAAPYLRPRPLPMQPPRVAAPRPTVIAVYAVARLTGTSSLAAVLDYEIDADLLAAALTDALLLDLV